MKKNIPTPVVPSFALPYSKEISTFNSYRCEQEDLKSGKNKSNKLGSEKKILREVLTTTTPGWATQLIKNLKSWWPLVVGNLTPQKMKTLDRSNCHWSAKPGIDSVKKNSQPTKKSKILVLSDFGRDARGHAKMAKKRRLGPFLQNIQKENQHLRTSGMRFFRLLKFLTFLIFFILTNFIFS